MTKADQLAGALDEFLAVSPEVEAAAVVSADGLPIASALPPHVEEDRLAAMSAALLTLGERAAEGLGKGELAQVFVEGDVGHVILMSAGHSAVLVAVSSKEAKVGLVLFEMRKTANKVSAIMNEDYVDAEQAASEAAQQPVSSFQPAPTATSVFSPETANGGNVGSVGSVGGVTPQPTPPAAATPSTPARPEPATSTETESSVSSWT